MDIKEALINKFHNRSARLTILGIGYVGLLLAVVFAEAGFHVIGVDPDGRKSDSVNNGKSYIPDISTERLAPLAKSGHLKATTDFSVLKEVDAASICVPTPGTLLTPLADELREKPFAPHSSIFFSMAGADLQFRGLWPLDGIQELHPEPVSEKQ